MKKILIFFIVLTFVSGLVRAETGRKEELKKLLAEAKMTAGKYEEAIRGYREILREAPRDIKTRINLADVLSWNKDYDAAIAEYEKVLEFVPGNLSVQKKIARVYTWKKDYASAEKSYKEIIKANPKDTEAYTALGEILTWQKRYSEANTYFLKAIKGKDPEKAKLLYGKTLLYAGQYDLARDVFTEILETNPKNTEAEIYLADTFAYSRKFKQAVRLYKEILSKKQNPEVRKKLADVLSWSGQYRESIKTYDEILEAEDNNIEIRLQKARVLGWDKQYKKSLTEYEKILSIDNNEAIRLEMEAKKTNWKHRIKAAIADYRKLIQSDPDNLEAIFDLSQIYSYQSMWSDAEKEYKKILDVLPNHFLAKKGMEKVELNSKHPSWRMGYEFFEADSPSRMTDIEERKFFNKICLPIDDKLKIDIDYLLTGRYFTDFHDLLENKGRVKFIYQDMPDFSASGYYGLISYNKDVDEYMHLFGGEVSSRVFDMGTFKFSYDKEELDNMSLVIREHRYRNRFKPRVDINLTRDVKLGVDYTYAFYSDDNHKNEPAFDLLCFLSRDPLRFIAKYRYFYRQFKTKSQDYFSPKGFSTSIFTFDWRHYLNKEGSFYGANDLYYELKYDISIDSSDIVGHKFSWGFNWDLNKRLNFNVEGSIMGSSVDVYSEERVVAGIKYYF